MGALVGDRHLQRHEFAALLGCVDGAEATFSDVDARMSAMGEYIAPALSSAVSVATRDGLLALVSAAVAPDRPALSRARARCEATSVLYVDHRLDAARGAYLHYLIARSDYYSDVIADGGQAYRTPDSIQELRGAAANALQGAAPDPTAARAVTRALPIS